MKRLLKTLIISSMALGCFIITKEDVYATNETNLITNNANSINIDENIRKSSFDYSIYSKEDLQKLLQVLKSEEISNSQYKLIFQFIEKEIEDSLINLASTNSSTNIYPLYILRDRIEYEITNNKYYSKEYNNILDYTNKEILNYENSLIVKEAANKKQELEEHRKNQIDWSSKFLQLLSPNFDWNNKQFDINSINIYDFFEDGQYCSPVDNPSLDRIITPFSNEHYFSTIKTNVQDNIYNIGNNGKVEVLDNNIIINYNNGVKLTYNNIIPCVKTGDIVNKNTIIGHANGESVDFSLSKKNKEYSADWLFTEYPFITEKGTSMPLFLQGANNWSEMTYGDSSIGVSGCGPAALAMSISYLNNKIITPAEIVQKAGGESSPYLCSGKGSYWTLIDECPSWYGLNSTRIDTNNVIDSLKNGNVVIAIMSEGYFTTGGHFIVLSGIDENNNIYVNDSADNFDKQNYNKTFTLESIASEANCFWQISK